MPENLRLLFAKEGRARYISHLDLIRTFQRSFLRGGMRIKHSEGYVPHPFVSVAIPLSLGYSSRCELMDFVLESGAQSPAQAAEKLNASLPEGLAVLRCYPSGRPFREIEWLHWRAVLSYPGGLPRDAAAKARELFARESLVARKKSKKSRDGYADVDVVPLIHTAGAEEEGDTLVLDLVLHAQEPGLNPQLLADVLVREYPELTPDFAEFVRLEVLDGTFARFE